MTLLERPAPTLSVVSAVQAAVRGRERQYQMRDQFESIRKGEVRSRELQEQLEIAVDASELGTFHCDMPLDKIVAYALPGAPALTAAHVITLSGWNNSMGVKQALVTTLDRHASYL